jgi:hypothetical protein
MLRKGVIAAIAAALGTASAVGVAACGEDREGDVRIEGGTTGTETAPARTERTETSP